MRLILRRCESSLSLSSSFFSRLSVLVAKSSPLRHSAESQSFKVSCTSPSSLLSLSFTRLTNSPFLPSSSFVFLSTYLQPQPIHPPDHRRSPPPASLNSPNLLTAPTRQAKVLRTRQAGSSRPFLSLPLFLRAKAHLFLVFC